MAKENLLADEITEIDRSETEGKFLTFWTDGQLFGVPIADVVQIVGIQEITVIPEFPDYAKGIINLRGTVIPVIDMRIRLHREVAEYNEKTCIIVTNISASGIGFIVDSVDAVTDIDAEKISLPPKLSKDSTNSYLTGVATQEDRAVLLLDIYKVLNEDVVAVLTESVVE